MSNHKFFGATCRPSSNETPGSLLALKNECPELGARVEQSARLLGLGTQISSRADCLADVDLLPKWSVLSRLEKGSCNFSWFYKISHLLKWLNLPFIIYLLLYWCYYPQNVFGKTKVYLLWQTKMFLIGNQKWQKKIEFEKLKIPKSWYSAILGDFQFFKFNFFCHFWFPIKRIFFLSKQTYFCLTKPIFGMIALIEKKIYYKR